MPGLARAGYAAEEGPALAVLDISFPRARFGGPHARNYLLSHRGVGPSLLARRSDLLTRYRIASLCGLAHLCPTGRAIKRSSQFRTGDGIGPSRFRNSL